MNQYPYNNGDRDRDGCEQNNGWNWNRCCCRGATGPRGATGATETLISAQL